MLFIYYTGAEEPNVAQNEARLSLGGYVSSSRVSNDVINNLFQDLSNFGIQLNQNDVKCIALKNDGDVKIEDILFYFTQEQDSIFEYDVAFVQPSKDKCGEEFYEKLSTSQSIPNYAEFVSPKPIDQVNQVNIGDLEPGQTIGIYIKRKLSESFISDNQCSTVQDLGSEKETLTLEFSW